MDLLLRVEELRSSNNIDSNTGPQRLAPHVDGSALCQFPGARTGPSGCTSRQPARRLRRGRQSRPNLGENPCSPQVPLLHEPRPPARPRAFPILPSRVSSQAANIPSPFVFLQRYSVPGIALTGIKGGRTCLVHRVPGCLLIWVPTRWAWVQGHGSRRLGLWAKPPDGNGDNISSRRPTTTRTFKSCFRARMRCPLNSRRTGWPWLQSPNGNANFTIYIFLIRPCRQATIPAPCAAYAVSGRLARCIPSLGSTVSNRLPHSSHQP